MKNLSVFSILTAILFACHAASTLAQQVIIADSGLDAAVRDALQKPTGPLTTQDLLSLTNLNASYRSISSLDRKSVV